MYSKMYSIAMLSLEAKIRIYNCNFLCVGSQESEEDKEKEEKKWEYTYLKVT